jgi:hypothetical protein
MTGMQMVPINKCANDTLAVDVHPSRAFARIQIVLPPPFLFVNKWSTNQAPPYFVPLCWRLSPPSLSLTSSFSGVHTPPIHKLGRSGGDCSVSIFRYLGTTLILVSRRFAFTMNLPHPRTLSNLLGLRKKCITVVISMLIAF